MRSGTFAFLVALMLALWTAAPVMAQQSSDQKKEPLTFATRGAATQQPSAEDREPSEPFSAEAQGRRPAEYPYGSLAMPVVTSADPFAPQSCLHPDWNRDWEFEQCMDYVTGSR